MSPSAPVLLYGLRYDLGFSGRPVGAVLCLMVLICHGAWRDMQLLEPGETFGRIVAFPGNGTAELSYGFEIGLVQNGGQLKRAGYRRDSPARLPQSGSLSNNQVLESCSYSLRSCCASCSLTSFSISSR